MSLLLNLLLPTNCAGCGRIGASLCDRCVRVLLSRPSPVVLRTELAHAQDPFAVSEVSAVRAIANAKDRARLDVLPYLSAALRHSITASCAAPNAYLVALPSTRSAAIRRGFSLPTEIVNERRFVHWRESRGNTVVSILNSTGGVRDQRELGVSGRRQNMAGAFVAATPESMCLRRDRDFVIVDDVVTTGATLAAATIALRRVGIDQIYTAAIAAVPRQLQS